MLQKKPALNDLYLPTKRRNISAVEVDQFVFFKLNAG